MNCSFAGHKQRRVLSCGFAFFAAAAPALPALGAWPQPSPRIVDYQPFKRETGPVQLANGGVARLTNLNENVGAWYLLRVSLPGQPELTVNIERPLTAATRDASLELAPEGLIIVRGTERSLCAPLVAQSPVFQKSPFAPICGNAFFVRAQGGTPDARTVEQALAARPSSVPDSHPPERAMVAPGHRGLGEWAAVPGAPDVFVATIRPGAAAQEILASHRDRVDALSATEAAAETNLVAFDLSRFSVGWSNGAGLPGVAWSNHPKAGPERNGLPGPDGFTSHSPLVNPGLLNPAYLAGLAGVMCGGFNRRDGFFRYGPLFGRYFGFIENGVIFSKPNQGIATLVQTVDGSVDIHAWSAADDANMRNVVSARQNNPPLIEEMGSGGIPVPGRFVSRANWGAGAWSGSANADFQTPRAGVCISEQNGSRYLIFGYFSSATPSAMARGFQSVRCKSAMHLDMNSPNQGFLAILAGGPQNLRVQPANRGMTGGVPTNAGGRSVSLPRYAARSDTYDFFYIYRK